MGSDEIFFDGDPVNIADLYNEKAGMLDEDEGEIDLTSQAYEIWKQAIQANPKLKKIIPNLPDVIYATKASEEGSVEGEGVIITAATATVSEGLTWLDTKGRVISAANLAYSRQRPVLRIPQHWQD